MHIQHTNTMAKRTHSSTGSLSDGELVTACDNILSAYGEPALKRQRTASFDDAELLQVCDGLLLGMPIHQTGAGQRVAAELQAGGEGHADVNGNPMDDAVATSKDEGRANDGAALRTVSDQPGMSDDSSAPRGVSPQPSTSSMGSNEAQPGTSHADNEAQAEFSITKDDVKAYTIQHGPSKSFKGKVLREQSYTIHFTDQWAPGPVSSLTRQLRAVFEEVLDEARRTYVPEDIARVYVTHPVLKHAIIIAPQRLGNITADVILQKMWYSLLKTFL
jgi:hypothetical protein